MKITYKNWMFDSSRTEKAAPTREQSLSCESISADTTLFVSGKTILTHQCRLTIYGRLSGRAQPHIKL